MAHDGELHWIHNLKEVWRKHLMLPLDEWQCTHDTSDEYYRSIEMSLDNDKMLGYQIRVTKENPDTAKVIFNLPISKEFKSFADNETMIKTLERAVPGSFRGLFVKNLFTEFNFVKKLKDTEFNFGNGDPLFDKSHSEIFGIYKKEYSILSTFSPVHYYVNTPKKYLTSGLNRADLTSCIKRHTMAAVENWRENVKYGSTQFQIETFGIDNIEEEEQEFVDEDLTWDVVQMVVCIHIDISGWQQAFAEEKAGGGDN